MTQPCCSRLHLAIRHEDAEVRRIARILARRTQSSLPAGKYAEQLAHAKRCVTETRKRLDDHEAEHAGTVDA